MRLQKHHRSHLLAILLIAFISAPAHAQAPSDETIAFWIGESLREDPRVAAADINVRSDAGIVSLTGTVRNLAERNYAGMIARKIQGVRGVVNRVDVFTVKRPDEDLASEIRQRISRSNPLRLREITLTVKEGIVTLAGTVESYGQKAEAELVATEVHGVRGVTNNLAIRYPTIRPDSQIRIDIEGSLNRDVYLTGNAVKDSYVVETGVSVKWRIVKKARLPHVACGLNTVQPRKESGYVTENTGGNGG